MSNGYFSKQRQSNGAISSNIIGKIVSYYPDVDAKKYITRSEKGDKWICLKSYNELHSPKDFELKYVNALALIKISIRINTM